ncbi:MAG: prepilin peptidase [Alphaproteobacteria bacterium]|nr:prepilin peptidase [Alphaproteobacteria bacterium]
MKIFFPLHGYDIRMIGLLVFLFGVFVTLGMCGLAAKSDYKGFKIPNITSIVIILAFAVTYAVLSVTGQKDVFFKPIGLHLGAAFLVFMMTSVLYATQKLGAGDSKFATAVSLWVGTSGLIPFLFYMSLAGGFIALISLYLQKKKPFLSPPEGGWIDSAQKGGSKVPYGIAIAIGAFFSFLYSGFFSLTKWESFF